MWTEVDSAVTQPVESDLTYSTMQVRVYTMLDNLPSQHPHYSFIPNYINEAKDELLMLGLALSNQVIDQLPRLRNWRWWDVTIDSQNWLPLPERMLYLERMFYTEDLTPYDVSTSTLITSTPIDGSDSETFNILNRTATGWPTLYRRAGSNIELWPTPVSTPTDYRTTIVVAGTRMDKDMSAGTDTLLMSPRMQLLVIDLAVAISMEKMGWEEADGRRASVEGRLARLIGPGVKERIRVPVNTRTAGTPQ